MMSDAIKRDNSRYGYEKMLRIFSFNVFKITFLIEVEQILITYLFMCICTYIYEFVCDVNTYIFHVHRVQ